jgi:hypothetical protein
MVGDAYQARKSREEASISINALVPTPESSVVLRVSFSGGAAQLRRYVDRRAVATYLIEQFVTAGKT